MAASHGPGIGSMRRTEWSFAASAHDRCHGLQPMASTRIHTAPWADALRLDPVCIPGGASSERRSAPDVPPQTIENNAAARRDPPNAKAQMFIQRSPSRYRVPAIHAPRLMTSANRSVNPASPTNGNPPSRLKPCVKTTTKAIASKTPTTAKDVNRTAQSESGAVGRRSWTLLWSRRDSATDRAHSGHLLSSGSPLSEYPQREQGVSS